jgi:glycosyltransferase involved in cell wall biosynthesis
MHTTVIIPNYNQGKFIHTALQSLENQTIKPDEVIIVDDKSTDNSVELIIKALKNFKINHRFLQREVNGYPAACRNTALKTINPETDIVFFLDADDWYEPTKIEKTLVVFAGYPDVGLVYSNYFMIDNNGQRRYEPKFSYNMNYLWQQCIVSTNSAVRRQVLETVGLFDERKDYKGVFEDYNLWLRISKKFLMYHIAEPLFTYRVHGENITLRHGQEMSPRIPELIKETYEQQ